MDNLDLTNFDRACVLLELAYDECSGLSQESLTKKDMLLDYFVGTVSSVFHRITSILTGHKVSSLEDYVRHHDRAVKDVLSATDIPYATLILPSPQGMVWPYPKTIAALHVLYKEDPPEKTIEFLKTFSANLSHRDRVSLAATLAELERSETTSKTELGLTDLFVENALGHKTGAALFGGQTGLKSAYTDLMSMRQFYTDGIKAAREIETLEQSIKQTIERIVQGSGIDKDSAAIAAKTLRLIAHRLRSMATLLVKMDAVEQNFVRCLSHLVTYRAKHA